MGRVKTLYIEPGSPWENGYIESFNGKAHSTANRATVRCAWTKSVQGGGHSLCSTAFARRDIAFHSRETAGNRRWQ